MLSLLTLSGVGFMVVMAYAMISMEEISLYAQRSAGSLSETARKESTTALLQLSKHHLVTIAEGQAAITDINLRNIPGKLDTLSLVYVKQGNAVDKSLPADNDGISYSRPEDLRSKCSYNSGGTTPSDSAIRNFSMMFDYLRNIYQTSDVIDSVSLISPGGEFIRYPWADIPQRYDLRELPWFALAKKTTDAVWSEPYYSAGTSNLIVTCAKAIRDGKGRLIAISAIDVNIKSLVKVSIDPRYQDNVTAFIIDREGYIIGSRGMSRKSDWKSAVLRQNILNSYEPGMIEAGRKMMAGESSITYLRDTPDKMSKFVAYAPIPVVCWSFGIIMSEEIIKKPVIDTAYLLNNQLAIQSNFLQNDIRGRFRGFMLIAIFFLGGTVLVLLWLTDLITRPLEKLIKATNDFDSGNYNSTVKIPSSDEIGVLARNFNKMLAGLKQYIQKNEEIIAASNKVENELNIAAGIQQAMLPQKFNTLYGHENVTLDALIVPSEKISGDFYDYTLISPELLHFYIGDVSDKGIPAAIFMTRIRTLLAAAAINSNSPALIISRVNDEMRRKNESCMFAAIWYAVVDLKTRELCFCNAGYNPPFIAHGEGDFLLHRNTVPTTPVGAFHPEETLYTEQHLTLDEGFSCFLYSDSIVETGGRDGEHFGQQRLARLLNSMKYDSCSRVINAVQQGISVFSENTPPQDDIAMMMIRIKTPGSETT